MKIAQKHNCFFLILCLLILINLCVALFGDFFTVIPAKADENPSGEQALEDALQEQLNKLDLKDLEAYLSTLDLELGGSVIERILTYVKGVNLDYSGFGKQMLQVLLEKVSKILPSFVCIAAVALLSGLISAIKSSSVMRTSADMIALITYVAALIPLLSVLTECFEEAVNGVKSMQAQMQIIYPLLLTLMAASGGTVSASVCRPAVAFFSNTIVSLITAVIFPITVAILVFSMAGNLTNELKIGKFTAFFKSINKWLIGISVSVFGLFFTLQGITAASYDGVVKRAVKYAIGNGIPIVGGFLSGGFDLAVASSVLIKNSLGSMGIVLMVSVVFDPLILLICVNLLLRLTAAITQPFGESKIADFMEETAENLNYFTAGLLFTAFLYFVSIMLMIYSTEALF